MKPIGAKFPWQLLATLAYTFTRIRAAIGLAFADYFPNGKRWLLRFNEKGRKQKELPVPYQLEQALDDYVLKTKLLEEPGVPLFPAARTSLLPGQPIDRVDAAEMIKRCPRQAGFPEHYSAHSFRVVGVTNFLQNGCLLDLFQRIVGHADNHIAKCFDSRARHVLVEDMQQFRY